MSQTHVPGRISKGSRRLGLVLSACALLGSSCGGDDDDDAATSDPQQFIGTWTATTGTLRVLCPALPLAVPPDDLAGDKLIVTAGTDAPLEADFSGCKVKFDIAGSVATARPGQTCTLTYNTAAGNFAAMLTVANATFSLKAPAGDYKQAGNASVALTFPGLPATTACTYDLTATATRS